jgi:hypothetical protein
VIDLCFFDIFLAENTSIINNNNNNNNSLNNNTIQYTDKSTQTLEKCEHCESNQIKSNKDELTQTDFTNLKESLSFHDCLAQIPYADNCPNSPPMPPPVPYRRINKLVENQDEHKDNHELSVQNLQFSIDNSISATTQTALAAVTANTVCDNGDVLRKADEKEKAENL